MLCSCKSKEDYSKCCFQYLSGTCYPKTPEQLMRSRYTAFTEANGDYIQSTMHGSITQNFDVAKAMSWAKTVDWLGLHIFESVEEYNTGIVEFAAYYKESNKLGTIFERSLFSKIDDKWFYTGREKNKHKLLGRNSLCPCLSGKKFKACCY